MPPKSKRLFDAQSFLDSAGLSRKIVEYRAHFDIVVGLTPEDRARARRR